MTRPSKENGMKAKKYNLGGDIADGVTGLAGGLLAVPIRALNGVLGTNLNVPSMGGGATGKTDSDEKGVIAKLAEDAQAGRTGTTMKKGGKVSSASKRADGIAQRGKTRGRMV